MGRALINGWNFLTSKVNTERKGDDDAEKWRAGNIPCLQVSSWGLSTNSREQGLARAVLHGGSIFLFQTCNILHLTHNHSEKNIPQEQMFALVS